MAEPKILNPDVVDETPETPAVAETPVLDAIVTPPVDQRDYVAELAGKDTEIATLRASMESAAATDTAASEQLKISLATAITERGALAKERNEAVKTRTAAINTMSQAVEISDETRRAVEAQLAQYDADLKTEKKAREEAEALATRYKVLIKEYPTLLPYAERIMASNDEAAVRADALAFAQTRESDLEGLRRSGIGQVLGLPTSAPTTPITAPTGPETLARELETAAKSGDAVAFARAKQAALDAYEASKAIAAR